MEKLKVLAGYALIMLLCCSALGVVAYLPENQIKASFSRILTTFEGASRLLLIAGAIAAALFLLITLAYYAARAWHRVKLSGLEVEEQQVNIKVKSFIFQTAPAGHQVYKHNLVENVTDPLHLIPGRANGGPVIYDREQLTRWEAYQILYSNRRLPGQSNQPAIEPGPRVLEPILPVLIRSQRLIIAGGSDAGKTTLIKHIIAGRSDHSRIVVIDPHSPSKVLGYDVIGAGRNYPAIGDALESLVLLMTARYEDVKAGLFGYGQHGRVSVFVDEWTSIKKEVEGAGDILATLLTESRKVNIHLTVCSHSTTVEALGLPDAQIRKSATIVEIVGGQGQPRRGFIYPASKTAPDGRKAAPVEYALPGPFPGFVEPVGQVVDLPSSRALKVQILAAQGFTVTAIARELFGVDKPNSRQIEEVKELLELTTDERQTNDN